MTAMFKRVTRKTIFFGISGAISACLAEVITETIPYFNRQPGSLIENVTSTALWVGAISLCISIGLLTAQNFYLKKMPQLQSALKVAILSILTGMITGGLAQIVFSLTANSSPLTEIVSRVSCWGILGLGVGLGTSLFVTNYPKKRAMLSGFIGGFIGGAVFRSSFDIFSEEYARVLGITILGLSIGLTISYLEEILREAWLTVVWGSNETSLVSLGNNPVILGSSSKADIYLPRERNYPSITAVMKMEAGKVIFENRSNSRRTELRDGSRINLSTVEVIVNIKQITKP
jgi:Ca-activated chloride channel family protein